MKSRVVPAAITFQPGVPCGDGDFAGGAFRAFTLNFTREDREQFVKGIQVHTPPGLLGMLSSVPLCGEPEADDGSVAKRPRSGPRASRPAPARIPSKSKGRCISPVRHGGAPFGLSSSRMPWRARTTWVSWSSGRGST